MIRDMEKRDLYDCVELVRVNWGDETAERFLNEALTALFGFVDRRSAPRYFVYEGDDELVLGFAGMMRSWIMFGVVDFIWINVHPDSHGLGIGRKLTAHRIEECRREGASLINLMTREYTFFERFGFRINRTFEPKGPGHGWAHMSLQLKDVSIDG